MIGLSDEYAAYCFDEVVHIFGQYVESELDGLEKGKKESDKAYKNRKQSLFLKLTGQERKQKFKNPIATK